MELSGNEVYTDSGLFLSLPTWCPNLTSPEARWTFGQYLEDGDDEPHTYFQASAGVGSNAQHHDGILSVSGLLIDEIVADEYNAQVPDQDRAESIVYELCFDLAHRYCKLESLALVTSFFRTITAGGRRACTRDYVSDSYLRFNLGLFFSKAPLGQRFRDLGCDEQLPLPADWYMDPHAHERYDQRPPAVERHYLGDATFVCTKGGRMGLVSRYARVGDLICVLFGCSSPVVLRPLGDVNSQHGSDKREVQYYHHMGEAYLDGFVHGEGIVEWREGRLQEQTFHIR
ncbi:hypothetical protein AMS68_008070 [Peltaster fructicola]|uniref:Heterokaryon incompatibility domain-containing protein n=1 Tax=Peltaster fructicola TaxID=286661 RepID=A0A6H0Y6C0_9PEZI|nr:hypothetical protein AMS68_008070 [Peltaster fructicola]